MEQKPYNLSPAASARPPAWFRYGVVAVATLMLCSCRGQAKSAVTNPFAETNPMAPSIRTDVVLTSANLSKPEDKSSDVVQAIYEADVNAPPARVHHANYGPSEDCLACQCAVEGSVVGPADEYLCDGGDFGLPAGVRNDWHVDGLEQEDTVAHYDTVDGRTIVTPSNRVCIYAPRFNVVRRVVDLHEYSRYDMPGGFGQTLSLSKINESEEVATTLNQIEPSIHRGEDSASLLRDRQQLGELSREQRLAEFDGSLAPYANLQIIRAGTISNNEKATVSEASLSAITWSSDKAVQVTIDRRRAQAELSEAQPGVVYHQDKPNQPKLRLVKLASTRSANPGEFVEFTLRFDNIGNREMGNVTIVDNLTTRLEYVPESATSSVEADFSTEPNGRGSVVLRWEIKQPLEAHQGGILQFKCRVR